MSAREDAIVIADAEAWDSVYCHGAYYNGIEAVALNKDELIEWAHNLITEFIVLTANHEAEVDRLRAALREVAQNACVWDRDAITAAIGEPT